MTSPPEIPETLVSALPGRLPSSLEVLDVREDDEWAAGHIEGATHIRMSEIPARVGELPDGAQVLVVCRVGARSGVVTQFLVANGIDAVNLAGGMAAWERAGRSMTSELDRPAQVI